MSERYLFIWIVDILKGYSVVSLMPISLFDDIKNIIFKKDVRKRNWKDIF